MVQKAVYLQKLDDTQIYFTYLNNSTFLNSEIIKFQTSNVNGVSSGVNIGSKEITSDFKFDNGQRQSIYDYSRIVRKSEVPVPQEKYVFTLHPQGIKTLMMETLRL